VIDTGAAGFRAGPLIVFAAPAVSAVSAVAICRALCHNPGLPPPG